MTFSAAAPSKPISASPVTSATAGVSSRMSRTRLPAAKVFCSVLPSAASAMAGPNDENSATVGMSTPSKPTFPARQSAAEVRSIARSNSRMTVFVTAVFRPATRFIRASSPARASVRAFISSSRARPRPNWIVSDRPRRLSSTKPASAPASMHRRRPASPESRDVTSGITTPTVTYAASASRPSAQ